MPDGWLQYSRRSRRLLHAPSAEVDGKHGLRPGLLGPSGELLETKSVGLGCLPCWIEPNRAIVDRPDPILPAIPRDEIPTRVTDDGHPHLPNQIQHVASESVLVGGLMSWLADPGVDAPPHVLHERSESPRIDRCDHSHRVDFKGSLKRHAGARR